MRHLECELGSASALFQLSEHSRSDVRQTDTRGAIDIHLGHCFTKGDRTGDYSHGIRPPPCTVDQPLQRPDTLETIAWKAHQDGGASTPFTLRTSCQRTSSRTLASRKSPRNDCFNAGSRKYTKRKNRRQQMKQAPALSVMELFNDHLSKSRLGLIAILDMLISEEIELRYVLTCVRIAVHDQGIWLHTADQETNSQTIRRPRAFGYAMTSIFLSTLRCHVDTRHNMPLEMTGTGWSGCNRRAA